MNRESLSSAYFVIPSLPADATSVLASAKRLVALGRADSRVLWQTELEAEVKADHFPLALQPTGEQVACCMTELQAVSVRDARTGAELRRLGPFEGWFAGARYSREGSCLSIFGAWGTKVYETPTGELRHTLVDKPGTNAHDCAVDPSGRFLAVTGNPGAAFVKDMRSGDNLQTLDDSKSTLGVGFDDKGERLAYFLEGDGPRRNGQVIVCDTTDGFRELKRVALEINQRTVTISEFQHASQAELLLTVTKLQNVVVSLGENDCPTAFCVFSPPPAPAATATRADSDAETASFFGRIKSGFTVMSSAAKKASKVKTGRGFARDAVYNAFSEEVRDE